jgi:bifunctional non-homologous end joining protein LigD
VIPEGNYGAGSMIAWDLGRVVYLDGTAEEGLARGKIDFTLSGFKLGGRFALVETGSRKGKGSKESGKQWLLIKKPDKHKSERDLLVEEPRSVLSGLTVDELARKADIAASLVEHAAAFGAPEGDVVATELTPMLCALEGARLDDPERLYELKLDGVRIVADKHERAVALRYRHGRPATAAYPEIARAVAALAPERLVLDGEIIAYDDDGRPSFAKLGARMHAERPLEVQRARASVPVSYLVFDVLQVGDRDVRGLPLVERKRLLSEIVRGRGLIRALDHLEGDGTALFAFCREQHLEGVVAKRMTSPYRAGPRRSDDWVKIKCERDDEFVVCGWASGKGNRERLGALCLASYGPAGLTYRGRVGSGLDEASIAALVPRLAALATEAFTGPVPPPAEANDSHWVRPELVVSVRYIGWTPEHHLRHPVFRGVRDDIDPASCRAMPASEQIEGDAAVSADADGDGEPVEASAAVRTTPSARVTVSNRDKVFWPEEGYTKGDLINYYAAVSPAMLPFLRERPVVMVRYPDGWKGKSFYQWNVPQGTPDWLRRTTLRDEEKDKEKTVFLVDDIDSLVYLANLGTIPLHVLACREGTRHEADFLTIDFDIGEHPFERAVVLALTLREILDEIGLPGYPKTSGQKGLHVLVPLGPGIGFETAKLLCEFLGRLVTARHPKLATMERRVDQRGGRALVDVGQTGTSRTIVAPYSVRAYPGATVSTPLHWDEVHVALDPRRFTLVTVPARLAETGDPFAGLLDERPDVPAAVEKLGELAAASGKS